jgi:hypothetical protein
MKTHFGGDRYYHTCEAHLKHISGAHSAYSIMFNTVNSTTKRLLMMLTPCWQQIILKSAMSCMTMKLS